MPGKTDRRASEHFALFYGDAGEFAAGTLDFVRVGLERGERVLVAVAGEKIEEMRAALNGGSPHAEFWDMTELGRNPGRIIPAVKDWVDRGRGRRCRFIGEPIWPGRAASEVVEATRHEALINLAFADAPVTLLCPYDVAGLDRRVLADAERTHPRLLRCGEKCADGGHPSRRYADPLVTWQARDWPLPDPVPAPPSHIVNLSDLRATRAFATRHLRAAGLGDRRLEDAVLAVDEAATNALVHGTGTTALRIWRDGDRVICEVSDEGRLEEPLAGRRRPQPDWSGGRGVWLMNQLCDLVELRPTHAGTVVRLHVSVAENGRERPTTGRRDR